MRIVYYVVTDFDAMASRPEPRIFAQDPTAQTDAERIADLQRITRRSRPMFLALVLAYALGTGAAAVYSAWGAPWPAWLAVALAVAVGTAVGTVAVRRMLPSVDEAMARMRAARFRRPPTAERPNTREMVVGLVIFGMLVAPMAGFHGAIQADLWALSGSVFVGFGVAMHRFGLRTSAALAALPEAQLSAGDAQTAEA